MPPKKAAGGRGPKASKLCAELAPKTEVPGKEPIVLLKEIGKGGFARVYKAELKTSRTPCAVKVEPTENGCLFVEMKLFQSILTESALNAYKAKHKLKFLGLPHCIRFGIFDYGPPSRVQSLRFIAMPLYHDSLQTYINAKPGKVIALADVNKVLPIIFDAYEYLHSEGVVHADLKAENLMFPIGHENDLKMLTLIDFGMAGRMTDRAVEKENKKQAHNGTAFFTSTDAHRGCLPTFRGDYEILGHNLLAWLGGLDKLPWKNHVKDLEKVYKLKRDHINDPKLVEKIVPSAKGGKLITGVYQVSVGTGYNERVDNSLLRGLVKTTVSASSSSRTRTTSRRS